MKRTLLSTALLAVLTVPSFAGTDSAPTTDSKDMKNSKDMKQMATEQSDAGFYVAAYGGAQFDTQYGDNRQTGSFGGFGTVSSNSDIHSGFGGAGGIKGGYNFNSFAVGNFMGLRLQPAVEAEGLYIGDRSHSTTTFGGVAALDSHFTSNSGDFFLNGILRFKNNSIVTPYIGVGAGLQYFTSHGTVAVDGVNIATGLNTSDLDFAAQGIFGLDVQICKHISLFSEYKFVDAIGTDGKNSSIAGGAITYRLKPDQIQQNLITAGVKYSF